MAKYNLRKIMKAAWDFKRALGLTMSEALKKSWAAAKAAISRKKEMESMETVVFENVIGARVELPVIVGVSDKQIKYAEDLRQKYLSGHPYELKKWVADTREYMANLDMDELHEAAVADGISDKEAINRLLSHYCYTGYKFWVAISEANASKIIDNLKPQRRFF